MYIKPGSMLGLLGGGQLGRMFAMAAQQMGYRVTVLDPAAESPAGSIAERHLQADYLNDQALDELGSTCAAVTIEFENVPAQALRYLARRCVVSPDAESVSIAQNRIREKQFLAENGFPVGPFTVVHDGQDLPRIDVSLFPGILKSSQSGYDGKGQMRIEHADILSEALTALGNKPCVLEKRLSLAHEISVVLARDNLDQITFFPVPENHHERGILDTSIIPATLSDEIVGKARAVARQVATRLNYVGILCVEFFVLGDGQILVNEIAPRPHNSGHYSLNACVTSQFEQQVRMLCGLPHGSTKLVQEAAVMTNILGDLWKNGEPDWNSILQHPQTKLHLYGKRAAKPGRKMGHFTVLADTVEEALQQTARIRQDLQF